MMKNTLIKTSFTLGLAALLLAGCGSVVTKVETGAVTVREKITVQVSSPWNQFERGLADNSPTWTQEGITVDALRFYGGIRDGQPLTVVPNNKAPLNYKAGMQPAEVVRLFETLHTLDGSTYQIDKLEPAEFMGQRGFRWEYSAVRKNDDVRLRGIGYGAVVNGELNAITYTAPRLAFFGKYQAMVETLIRSAQPARR